MASVVGYDHGAKVDTDVAIVVGPANNEFVVAYLYEAKTYKSVELFLLSPAILFAHVADIL